MSVVDDFLKKMKMVSDDDDDYDDYDDYDDLDDEEDVKPAKKAAKPSRASKKKGYSYSDPEDDEDEEESYYSAPKSTKAASQPAPQQQAKTQITQMRSRQASSEVCMILPKSFDDANTIADMLLSRKAVVLNLEGIDMSAAQRIIDFASGACYTVGGSLQKISKKIFIVVPPDTSLSGDFDEIIGDMIDLNQVNMLK